MIQRSKWLAMLAFLFVSFALKAQSYQKDPVLYNDKIVNAQNAIGREILTFVDFMGQADWEGAENQLSGIISVTDEKILEIGKMTGYKGSITLRDAALDLFKFYNRTFKTDYQEILQILKKDELTEEDQGKLGEIINHITEEEGHFDEKFRNAQTTFATTHNITLIENELQEEIEELDAADQ